MQQIEAERRQQLPECWRQRQWHGSKGERRNLRIVDENGGGGYPSAQGVRVADDEAHVRDAEDENKRGNKEKEDQWACDASGALDADKWICGSLL